MIFLLVFVARGAWHGPFGAALTDVNAAPSGSWSSLGSGGEGSEMGRSFLAVFLAVLAFGAAAQVADEGALRHGGDLFTASGRAAAPTVVEGDLFAVGATVAPAGRVGGDAHLAGFSVTMRAPTGGDLYAVASDLAIAAPVGDDATLSGGTVRLEAGAAVAGNLRATGGVVELGAPVEGAALIAAHEVRIDAPVSGDLRVAAASLTFGPEARIGGRLFHAGPEPVAIPASVIPPDRVTFERWAPGTDIPGEWERPVAPDAATAIGGALAVLFALVIVGGLLLVLMPERIAAWHHAAERRPGAALLWGAAVLAALFGAIPVLALTLAGLLLIPVAALAIGLAWVGGWLLGAFVLGMVVAERLGLGPAPSLGARIGVLAGAALVAALLNVVPVIGWLLNLGLLLLGLGAVAVAAGRAR
jgi:hypothetical protein